MKKAAKTADIYGTTEFANTPAHGVFLVSDDKNGKKNKMPLGEHGCGSFLSPAGDVQISQTRLLGRSFGSGDGVIGIDIDNAIPTPEWHGRSGYREVSASGNGCHVIARVPIDMIPGTGSKIVIKRGFSENGVVGDIEIFYGRNNGIAITQYDAEYFSADLDLDSPCGQLVAANLAAKKSGTKTPTKSKVAHITRGGEEKELPPARDIVARARKWARLSNPKIPTTPSEAFLSVCTRIAGDLGQKEAYTGKDGYLTPKNVLKIWETTEIYRHYYAGEQKYAAHKIEPTLDKAMTYGVLQKKIASKARKLTRKFTNTTGDDTEDADTHHACEKGSVEPLESPKNDQPSPAKHPEGYCVSDDGVPEFWCDDYPHPLRYHMAHIARYAQAAMQQPNAITAWICAVFFGTVVCARQFAAEISQFGANDSALIFPRLYAIVSGISGAGKDDITHGLEALVEAVSNDGTPESRRNWCLLAQSSNWSSDAAVHAAIAERPQSVAIWDECGRKIQRAQNDVIANSMLMKLTEAFSRANSVLKAPHYANPKDQQQAKGTSVWHPAMSVIGLGTPRQMESITEDMVESGQFARFLFYTIPHRKHVKPLKRVKFNLATHAAITDILSTATYGPEMRLTKRQQVRQVLSWDPHAPKTGAEVRGDLTDLSIAAKSSADKAILNRVFEIGGIMAISRTILGTKHGLEAEYIPYDVMIECIVEAQQSLWHMHTLVVDAPVYTPREMRIADAIEEIYRDELGSPIRAYYGTEIAPALKLRHIMIGGKQGERQNIDAILIGRGIAAGKEGNTPTGRKYYYNATTLTAQGEQEEYDARLRAAAKYQEPSP